MPENSDPYLYPKTNLLRNIPGIRDLDSFLAFEANAVHARNLELREFPTKGRFDAAHLREVHRTLFQDVAQAGYALDWRRVDRDTMIEASRQSFSTGDNQSMVAIIRSCTV